MSEKEKKAKQEEQKQEQQTPPPKPYCPAPQYPTMQAIDGIAFDLNDGLRVKIPNKAQRNKTFEKIFFTISKTSFHNDFVR